MEAQLVLLAAAATLQLARGGIVRVANIDPAAQGSCGASFTYATTTFGQPVCLRNAFPATSYLVDAAAAMTAAANVKGLGYYTRITVHIEAYQKGSMDAFERGIRDDTGLDSNDYVDGLSITYDSPRVHLATFAVGASYDTNTGTDGLCPCVAGSQALVCGGASPPSWLATGTASSQVVCDSGNYGGVSSTWEPRKMTVDFDFAVFPTSDVIEVRFMADQPSANEDIGVSVLRIEVDEAEDHVSPVLTLIGPAVQLVEVFTSFVEQGSTCVDDTDGTRVTSIVGSVNTNVVGQYAMNHSCSDTHGNYATATRTVRIIDPHEPQVTIYVPERICILQGETYVERGASCFDIYDGYFEAVVNGTVDTSTPGTYVVRYECVDRAGNAHADSNEVVVYSSALPGNIWVSYFQLQTSLNGTYETGGAKTVLQNVHPHTDVRVYWSEDVALGTERCRFVTLQRPSPSDLHVYEGVNLDASTVVSGNLLSLTQSRRLRDLTTYTIVLDEHLLVGTAGSNAGQGNLRQMLKFITGDYTGPTMIASSPAMGESAWPLSDAPVFSFNEVVQAGGGVVLLRQVLDDGEPDVEEVLPCTGAVSMSGARVEIQNNKMILRGLEKWSGWRGCQEYYIEIESDCVADSTNSNPLVANASIQFVTSCIVDVLPKPRSVDVSIDSPVVLTFSEPVQAGAAKIMLQPLGEPALQLHVTEDFPVVYIKGTTMTIDPACKTKVCSIYAANGTTSPHQDSSRGLCSNRTDMQRCQGKRFSVRFEEDAVRLVGRQWPQDSLLVNLSNALPAQLIGNADTADMLGAYYFTLKPADITPPVITSVDVAAASEGSLTVTVRMDEPGTIKCAAFIDPADKGPCKFMDLVEEYSHGACNTTDRDDCLHCHVPAYDCLTRMSMRVWGGCAGKFTLDGVELQCTSAELDRTVFEGGAARVLSVGGRHGCAVRKSASGRTLRCWGNSAHLMGITVDAVSSVSAGWAHTCSVAATGAVVCFGLDAYGETAGAVGNFTLAASGYRFACALRAADGEAECWGLNDEGQSSPPSGIRFDALFAGDRHVCGRQANDSSVVCWGMDHDGQASPPALRFLAQSYAGTPLPIGSLSAGYHHTCGIVEGTDAIRCWGRDTDGQASPPAGRWIQVAAGADHTCGIRKSVDFDPGAQHINGTAVCWGRNDHGQCAPPVGARFSAISAGDGFTCGILLETSVLVCWGLNDYQQATPPDGEFGALDEFSQPVCHVDTTPTLSRIGEPHPRRAAGASAIAALPPAAQAWRQPGVEAKLQLDTLAEATTYEVYCYAFDDELITPNSMSEQAMAATRRVVTTLDRTPPGVQLLEAVATAADTVTVTARLTEPGVAFCRVVRDGEKPPEERELWYYGTSAAVGSDLQTSITITGLERDTEFDAYCTARDQAGHHPDAGGVHNWLPYETVVLTKVDVHTLLDTTPPKVDTFSPPNSSFAVCEPDGAALGCKTTITLTFNEDVQRGTGNVTVQCLTNLLVCTSVTMPIDTPSFVGGTTEFVNRDLRLHFTDPLTDASVFKVIVDEGVVKDAYSNSWGMDTQCESWFQSGWEQALAPCKPAYTFETPS